MRHLKMLLGSFVVGSCFWVAGAYAQATDVDCDGCVDSTDIADGGVRGKNIANGHIVSRHIKNGSLITEKIKDGAITAEKIAASAVGVTQVDPSQVQLRVGDSCAVGSFIAAIAEDGAVTCGAGTDADYNTLYGSDALASNTPGVGILNEGTWNTAVGFGALRDNTTGKHNTATGGGALWLNTTGSENTATGMSALGYNTTGQYNTATGVAALYSNTTGWGNTAYGRAALPENTEGHSNTATGYSALGSNTTGNRNVAIGVYAGWFLTTGDYNIVIGADNYGVAGEGYTTRIGTVQTRAFIAGVRGVTTGVADAVGAVIDSNGQLGTISSSVRYKEDIHEMGEASERLLQLRPVTFRYKEPYENGEKPTDFGLIAEEVAEVFPELVVYNDEGQPETVKYRLLSTLLLNELQKDRRTLGEQDAKINNLEAQVQELTRLVTQLAKSGELSQETLVAANGAD